MSVKPYNNYIFIKILSKKGSRKTEVAFKIPLFWLL